MSTPIILIGAGGHARSCIDVLELEGRFRITGLLGLEGEVGSEVLGYPVVGTDADIPGIVGPETAALVTVGQVKTPVPRIRLFETLAARGCELPSIVSPLAHVSPHASIGAGTIVMHGAVVNAGARVGRNCILNTRSLVEHDATVGDSCHVSTGAIVNGGASVGAGSFVGSGAIVRERVTLGANCLIGMGERVMSDCADGTRLIHGVRRP